MTEGQFRVGITPDFRPTPGMPGRLDDALKQYFGASTDIEYGYLAASEPVMKREDLEGFDVVISLLPRYTAESLINANRLVAIGRWGVGFDMIDVGACTANDVLVFITPTAVRRPMAESVIALVLALAKDVVWRDRLVREGRWADRDQRVGICVQGRTLGTIGLGNIGAEVMRLARALGFGNLLAYSPGGGQTKAAELGVELVDLSELLQKSDFVTVNCPLNAASHHLIGARELSLMRPTAWLINTARGGIVDTEAIVEALKQGLLRGAALDVFEDEPLPASHPLCQMDNVILSPHSIIRSEEVNRNASDEVCAGVFALRRGRLPNAIVNPEVLIRPQFQEKLARIRRL